MLGFGNEGMWRCRDLRMWKCGDLGMWFVVDDL